MNVTKETYKRKPITRRLPGARSTAHVCIRTYVIHASMSVWIYTYTQKGWEFASPHGVAYVCIRIYTIHIHMSVWVYTYTVRTVHKSWEVCFTARHSVCVHTHIYNTCVCDCVCVCARARAYVYTYIRICVHAQTHIGWGVCVTARHSGAFAAFHPGRRK